MNPFEASVRNILKDKMLSEDRKVERIMSEARDYFMPLDSEMYDS